MMAEDDFDALFAEALDIHPAQVEEDECIVEHVLSDAFGMTYEQACDFINTIIKFTNPIPSVEGKMYHGFRSPTTQEVLVSREVDQ